MMLQQGVNSFTINNPSSSTLSALPLDSIPGLFSRASCNEPSGCDIISVVCDGDGHTGVYGLSGSVVATAASLSVIGADQNDESRVLLQRENAAIPSSWPVGSASLALLTESVVSLLNSRVSGSGLDIWHDKVRILGSDSGSTNQQPNSTIQPQFRTKEQIDDDVSVEHSLLRFRGQSSGSWKSGRSGASTEKAQFELMAISINAASKTAGYTNPLICLLEGEGILFDLSSGALHYPVYLKDNLLNTNPSFDYGAFELLAERIAANASAVSAFAFTFSTAGKYVFADNANRDKLTIISVLSRSTSCPSASKIMAASNTNLISMGLGQDSDLLLEPDLTIVIVALCCFLGSGVVIGLYARMRQAKSLRKKMLEDDSGGEDNSAAEQRKEFVTLYRKLEDQRAANQKLFDRQRRDFRSECNRVCAETEQVKALLAIKAHGSDGDLALAEAAERLLLAEVTSRTSYWRRQEKREDEIVQMLQSLYAAVTAPELEMHVVQALLERSASKITAVTDAADKERSRRRTLVASSGIIGENIVAKLSEKDLDEARVEDSLLNPLKSIAVAADHCGKQIKEERARYRQRKLELEEARNAGVPQLTERHTKSLKHLCGDFANSLNGALTDLGMTQYAIKNVREESRASQGSVEEMVALRKQKVTVEVERGLFRGIDSELANALRTFLSQSTTDLVKLAGAVGRGGADMDDMQPGASRNAYGMDMKMPGDSSYARPISSHTNAGSSGAASQDTEEQVPVISVRDSMEESAEQVRDRALAEAEDAAADLLNRLADRDDVGATELAHANEALKRQQQMLSDLLEQERAQLSASADGDDDIELNESVLPTQIKSMLNQAKLQIESLRNRHQNEEQQLISAISQEEDESMKKELADREKREKEIEAERSRLSQELQEKLNKVDDQDDTAGIMKEHQLQLRKLDDILEGDRKQSSNRLKKVRANIRAKRAKKRAALKKRQKQELAKDKRKLDAARAEAQTVVALAGTDGTGAGADPIPGMAEVMRLAQGANGVGKVREPTGAEVAMRREHQRLQQDLQHEHEHEHQVLMNELDQEQAEALDRFDENTEQQQHDVLVSKRADLEAQVATRATDADEAAALMAEHEHELADLEAQLESERARQRQKLEERLAKKRAEKSRDLRKQQQALMARELKQQNTEQQDLADQLVKDKEREILDALLLHVPAHVKAEKRRQAKGLIERVLRPRQRREKADMTSQQWEHLAKAYNEKTMAMFAAAQEKRGEAAARRKRGVLSEADYQARLAELDEEEMKHSDPEQLQALVRAELKEPQAIERAELKGAQRQNVRDLFKRYYPDEDFSSPEWQLEDVDLDKLLQEQASKREQEEQRIADQIKQLQRQEEEFKLEQEKKLQDAIREYDERVALEQKQHEIDLEQRLKKQQEEALHEQTEITKQKLAEAAATGNDDLKEQIMKEHEAELTNQTKALELERARQKEKFAARLKKQQDARRRRELRKLQQDAMKEVEQEREARDREIERLEEQKKQGGAKTQALVKQAAARFLDAGTHRAAIRRRVAEAASRFKRGLVNARLRMGLNDEAKALLSQGVGSTAQELLDEGSSRLDSIINGHGAVSTSSTRGNQGTGSSGGDIGASSGSQYASEAHALPGGPAFFDRLQQIENVLGTLLEAEGMNPQEIKQRFAGEMLASDGKRGGSTDEDSLMHRDAHDSELKCEGSKPQPCSLNDLNVREFVLYRFGATIMDLLTGSDSSPRVNLLLAKMLPAKALLSDFDQNAYRNSYHFDAASRTLYVRVERTADAGDFTLVLIHAMAHVQANEWADTHPKFIREFYKNLRVCCGELFFARGGGSSPNEVREMFGLVSQLPDKDAQVGAKEQVVDEFLRLQHGKHENDIDSNLEDRLQKYKIFAYSGELREHLQTLEHTTVSELLATRDNMESKHATNTDVLEQPYVTFAEDGKDVSIQERRQGHLEHMLDDLHKQALDVMDESVRLSTAVVEFEHDMEQNHSQKEPDPLVVARMRTHRQRLQVLALERIALDRKIQMVEARINVTVTD
jgi:hypothetical protein